MTSIQSFFDQAYSTHDRYWWKSENAYSIDPIVHAGSLMTQQVLRLAIEHGPGRAVDIGSGEGADAIRLARLGWTVDSLELSGVGASKIERFASEQGVQVRVHVGDLMDFEFDEEYDLVVCNGVLHYIEDKEAACARLHEITRRGGFNAVSLWSDFTPVPSCHEVLPCFPDRERGAVFRAYSDWGKRLHYFERGKAEASHDEMPSHCHSHIKLIGQKPQ